MKAREQEWRFLDALNGHLCATMLEPYRNREERPEPFKSEDFMILPPEEKEKSDEEVPKMGDSPEELKHKLDMMAASGLLKKVPHG